jgi:hypothetical protein
VNEGSVEVEDGTEAHQKELVGGRERWGWVIRSFSISISISISGIYICICICICTWTCCWARERGESVVDATEGADEVEVDDRLPERALWAEGERRILELEVFDCR